MNKKLLNSIKGCFIKYAAQLLGRVKKQPADPPREITKRETLSLIRKVSLVFFKSPFIARTRNPFFFITAIDRMSVQ